MEEKLQLLVNEYCELRSELIADQYIDFLMNWDAETVAPSGSFRTKEKYCGIIGKRNYERMVNPRFEEVVYLLSERVSELDEVLAFEIAETKKGIEKTKKIPKEEYIKSCELFASSAQIWGEAKRNNDYAAFYPTLKSVVEYEKKYIKWMETEEVKGYDVLLDKFEPDSNQVMYDEFFDLLRRELVPFVKKITSLKLDGNFKFGKKKFEVAKQEEFVQYMMDALCFDKTKGLTAKSEHPFTSSFKNSDVRVSNHYSENNFQSCIFSIIHEVGHGLYEQQSDDSLNETMSNGGASMALHESQSRFYENIIGRSVEFWQEHFGKLKELFPKQLKDVTLEDFVKYINIAEISYVRTEADELTYPLHIMLRYQIEKELFSGKLTVKGLKKRWNELFYEYFGIRVRKDSLGILQDTHWSCGLFGYFPTYALGSAYSAQIFNRMNKDFDVFESLKEGNTKRVNEWLKEKLHKFGCTKKPIVLYENMVGEKFDAMYYVRYLKEKYSKIYGIEDID